MKLLFTLLSLFLLVVTQPVQAQKNRHQKHRSKPMLGSGDESLIYSEAVQPPTSSGSESPTSVAAPSAARLITYYDSVSYAVGVNIATAIRERGMDSLRINFLLDGLRARLSPQDEGALAPQSLLLVDTTAETVLTKYFQQAHQQKAFENKKAAEAFLTANKSRPGIVTLAGGLQYQVLNQGTGPSPTLADQVKVHYTGSFIDGSIFYSSVDKAKPVQFEVGQVIKGWQQALQLMKVGAKWRVFLHPELGYGDLGIDSKMPPNSLLIFELELLQIGPGPAHK